MSRFAKIPDEFTCTIATIASRPIAPGAEQTDRGGEMDDGFKPAIKQLPTEARLRSDKPGARAIVCVDNEYADEFNLNDIGLAMFLSTYRALP